MSTADKIIKIKELLDSGAINRAEFQTLKQEILAELAPMKPVTQEVPIRQLKPLAQPAQIIQVNKAEPSKQTQGSLSPETKDRLGATLKETNDGSPVKKFIDTLRKRQLMGFALMVIVVVGILAAVIIDILI